MICWIRTDDNHVARDSGRPDSLGIFKELDFVDSAAVWVWYDDCLVLSKVGGGVRPPLRI